MIGLIGVLMIYETMGPLITGGFGDGAMFWLQTVLMLVGAAAVWRIGSILHARTASVRYAQG